ncbi:Dihydrolipoyl dehydrogenase mitochondrial [Bienertia sinuspersici]
MVEVGKPLRRGIKITQNNNNVRWVDIKYERLGDFCYYCSMLGHVDRNCTMIAAEEVAKKEMVYKYGPWLQESPLKRYRLSKEEYDKEVTMLNKLQRKEEEVDGELCVTKLGPLSQARKVLFREGKEGQDEGRDMIVAVRNDVEEEEALISDDKDSVQNQIPKDREECEVGYNKKRIGSWKRIPRQVTGVEDPKQLNGGKGV